MKEETTLFTSPLTQHELVDKLGCSEAYCTPCGACKQKYIVETVREIRKRIKKHETERSELAEHIAQTGHEMNWRATERTASYDDNTKKRNLIKETTRELFYLQACESQSRRSDR
ncbi:unnamed protein product [Protopolystoma xenopodis]|uniref:Uncharacterized protein n=1 Tax=Protopolystoma xenopodis TaxID=117903 RepID=A0A448XCW4_9PLAT|nr:unnamed protein product [Protopolystoma xenopodis]